MKILSLFDGISCGRVALERAGIPVERYVAYEIDKYAKTISAKNYPDIEQCGDVFDGDFTQYKGFDLIIGGSPCTYWSIAKNNRETTCEGEGYKLFMQYVRALRESGCRWFLYENNYSIHQNIKDAISAELGVQPIMINSALVSAQTRKRCYWTNIPNIEQPADRGVLLKDIIESGESFLQKAYALTTRCSGAIPSDTLKRHRHTMIAEPVMYQRPREKNEGGIKEGKAPTVTSHSYEHNNLVVEPIPLNTTADGKAKCLRAGYGTKDGIRNMVGNNYDRRTCVAIPAADVVPKQKQIYKVESGQIDIKGKLYPIKLADGYYIIRKLLPIECERLQTLPEGYTEGVSDAQRIKALGNGWTVEVIAHILKHIKEVKS